MTAMRGAVVAKLVDEIGANPVNAGPLALARYTEPACMLLVQLAYAQGLGARIGVTFVRETAGAATR